MLNRLVLADRTIEYDAFFGIVRRALERNLAQAHRLGSDQYALGIHAVQYVFETAAFLADTVGNGDFQAVDEYLVGVNRFTTHLRNLARFHILAVEVGIEQAQPVRRFAGLLE